jgi:23S rRNA (uracil1939-C5)-methyltransferase
VLQGERVTVDCVDLDDDGAAIDAGTTRLHVAGALPGERVIATVAHVSPHAQQAWARLETVETPSAMRRAPACRAFGACGGCVLQHLAYEGQLAWKQARVARALGAYPALADVPLAAPTPSPRTLGYRNRSKLVAARRGGRLVLGAYAPRSHDVIDLAGCRIAEPPLDETAAALAAFLDEGGVAPYDERSLTGDLRHVVLQGTWDSRVLAVWVTRRALPDAAGLARAFRRLRPEVAGVVAHLNPGRGNAIFDAGGETATLDGAGAIVDQLQVEGRPLQLRLSAGAFFQANREVAALAYAAIGRGLAPRPGERAVDVYCGVGGISLALARAGAETLGIETHAGAVADATASAALEGTPGARFVAGDAVAALRGVNRADLVVLNPPRRGCAAAVLAEVVRLAPRAVAYLSCDPDTLARDLAWLAARGYRAREVTPFDMLPHTPHVEVLALVVPDGSAR